MIRIELLRRGFGRSPGNMAQVGSGEAGVLVEGSNWIVVEEKDGVFQVVDNGMTVEDADPIEATVLGFSRWDGEVEDLDNGQSEAGLCFGMSSHLRWQNVDMTPYRFIAPNIECLKQALTHVEICAWCPEDV